MTTSKTPIQDSNDNNRSFLKSLLPLVGAFIFALLAWILLKSCQQNPSAIARPDIPTQTQIDAATANQATLNLVLNPSGDNLYAAHASVGGVKLQQQLQNLLATNFGNADKTRIDIMPRTADTMPILTYLPQVLGFIKGVPDASLSIMGKELYINTSNTYTRDKLIADLSVALPDDFVVMAEPALDTATTTTHAINAAQNAMATLTPNSSTQALVQALNLQIINFAKNSNEIPSENQAILNQAAQLLQQMPNARLQITGHTDNSGSASHNKQLSQIRAMAVRDYLVAQGVKAERLTVLGMGFDEPIASNATEQGRFKNRRIEFAVANDTP